MAWDQIIDIPFLIMNIVVLLFAPWRFQLKIDRQTILNNFYRGIFDILTALGLFLFVIVYFSRWGYIIYGVKGILKNDKTTKKPNNRGLFKGDSKYNSLQALFGILLGEFCLDILAFVPFILINTILIWPLIEYYRKVKKNFLIEVWEFKLQRQFMFNAFQIGFYKLLYYLLKSIVFITYRRRSTLKYIQNYNLETINKRKTSFYILHEKGSTSRTVCQFELEMYIKENKKKLISVFICLQYLLQDLLVLIPEIFIFITYLRLNKWKKIKEAKWKELNEKYENKVEALIEYETFKLKNSWIQGLKVITFLILASIILVMVSFFLWRIPTLYIIYKNPVLVSQILKYYGFTQQQQEKLSKFKKSQFLIIFIFKQWLIDVILIPITIITTILAPVRVYTYLKNLAFKYESKFELNQLFNEKRKLFFNRVFIYTLKDWQSLLEFILIIVTGIRLYYLILLVRRNKFHWQQIKEEYLTYKISFDEVYKNIRIFLRQIEQQQLINRKLTIKTIIHITFKEMVYDIPFFIFSLFITVVSPYKIHTLIKAIKKQYTRLPAIIFNGKITIISSRLEIFEIFYETFTYDLPCVLMNIILICTVYKIPVVFRFLKKLLKKHYFSKTNSSKIKILGEFIYREQLWQQIRNVFRDLQMLGQLIIILLSILRVKSVYIRINRLYKRHQQDSKIKILIKNTQNQINSEKQLDLKEKKSDLNSMSFNIFTCIAEYLDVDDLCRLQRCNKRFYVFSQSEIIFKKLYLTKWHVYYTINNTEDNYRQKCIKAFDNKKRSEFGKPITLEDKDKIYGYQNIIFEEFLFSILDLPNIIIIPFKFAAFVCNNMDYSSEQCSILQKPNNHKYCPMLARDINHEFQERLVDIRQNRTEYGSKFENLHLRFLEYFLYYFFMNYYNYVYYVTLPAYYLMKITSVGPMRNVQIQNFQNVIDFNDQPAYDISETKKTLLYLLQFLTAIFISFSYLVLQFIFMFYSFMFTDKNWFKCIIGPYGYYLFHFIVILSVIINVLFEIQRFFPYFRPFEIIIILRRFILKNLLRLTGILKRNGVKIFKPLYDILANGFLKIEKIIILTKNAISSLIRMIIKGLKNIIVVLIDQTFKKYNRGIGRIAKFLFKFGLLGDGLLTIIAICYMFWPLYVAYYYYYDSYAILISSFIFSIIFMISGYRNIQKEFELYSKKQ